MIVSSHLWGHASSMHCHLPSPSRHSTSCLPNSCSACGLDGSIDSSTCTGYQYDVHLKPLKLSCRLLLVLGFACCCTAVVCCSAATAGLWGSRRHHVGAVMNVELRLCQIEPVSMFACWEDSHQANSLPTTYLSAPTDTSCTWATRALVRLHLRLHA